MPLRNTQNRGTTTAEPSHRLMQKDSEEIKRVAIVPFCLSSLGRLREDLLQRKIKNISNNLAFKSFYG
ncbi:hypothetical protein CEXT_122491 [Caerostris extrusa]|uniref:Uncharacterized protein n=1 Tax=Caerostris extrusa TaxID=172846 RepID=A0AAV4M7U9_CAEEX|nr:hypothetical protein CEXT_122491 [Caerostris extrusa]